jgi:hypothetical protein
MAVAVVDNELSQISRNLDPIGREPATDTSQIAKNTGKPRRLTNATLNT